MSEEDTIMKIAIVHDFLLQRGGSERCLDILLELFPEADVFTLLYDKKTFPDYERFKIKESFLKNFPLAKNKHYYYLPLYNRAIRSFDLSKHDLIISSSHAFAKNIRKHKRQTHICYCHSPMRSLYDIKSHYIEDRNVAVKLFLNSYIENLREKDIKYSESVDHFIANSSNVKERIKRHYKRDSLVIYPPVDTCFFNVKGSSKEFYLIVSRLVRYKMIDMAIRAFNEMNKKLVIVGNGPELNKLRKIAKSNITFISNADDNDVRESYQKCIALIYPQHEDFGITSLEAQACGRPVIAYAKGGALETVKEGETGIFFRRQTADDLIDAVKRFEKMSFDAEACRKNSLNFSKEKFKKNIKSFVSGKLQDSARRRQ